MSSTVFFADTNGDDLAVLTNTFSVSGTPTDPSTVSVVVTDPEGNQTTYSNCAVASAPMTICCTSPRMTQPYQTDA